MMGAPVLQDTGVSALLSEVGAGPTADPVLPLVGSAVRTACKQRRKSGTEGGKSDPSSLPATGGHAERRRTTYNPATPTGEH